LNVEAIFRPYQNDRAMKTILIPVDFQAAAGNVLHYIENVFKDQSIKVELLYVLTPSEKMTKNDVQKSYLDFELKYLKGTTLPHHFTMVEGKLLDQIQNKIDELRPSLVAIGLSGNSLVKSLLKLVRCPLLMIPGATKSSAIRNIVYANDFQNIKISSAFEPLWDFAKSNGARIHIVHVTKGATVPSDEEEGSLEYYLENVEHEYASIKSDDFVGAINNYATEKKVDLLTLLLRDHGNNALPSRGKFVQELLTRTRLPILTLV
jgi:hypothetical protein